MQELNTSEIREVSGGVATLVVIGVIVAIDLVLIGVTVGAAEEASKESSEKP